MQWLDIFSATAWLARNDSRDELHFIASERNYDRLDQTMFCYGIYDAMGMCTKENQMVINNVKQFELVKRNGKICGIL